MANNFDELNKYYDVVADFASSNNLFRLTDELNDLKHITGIDGFKLFDLKTYTGASYKDKLYDIIDNTDDAEKKTVFSKILSRLNRHFDPTNVYVVDAKTSQLMTSNRVIGRVRRYQNYTKFAFDNHDANVKVLDYADKVNVKKHPHFDMTMFDDAIIRKFFHVTTVSEQVKNYSNRLKEANDELQALAVDDYADDFDIERIQEEIDMTVDKLKDVTSFKNDQYDTYLQPTDDGYKPLNSRSKYVLRKLNRYSDFIAKLSHAGLYF